MQVIKQGVLLPILLSSVLLIPTVFAKTPLNKKITASPDVIHALKSFTVRNGDEVRLKVSATQQNRFVLDGDRFVNASFPLNAASISMTKGSVTGELFLTVNPLQKKPFSIQITTRQGRFFNVLVTPTAMPAINAQFKLVSKGVHQGDLPLDASYASGLADVMKQMMNGKVPKGWGYTTTQGLPVIVNAYLTLTPLGEWQGNSKIGEKLLLTNTSTHTWALKSGCSIQKVY